MNNMRNGVRVKCDARCVLVLDGAMRECTLEDISMTGALVQLCDRPVEVRPGSRCDLYLCHDPNMCPGKCACQVTRVIQKNIGLTFVHSH